VNSDIISYYKDRAQEYEKVYNKPERLEDLLVVEQILKDTFTNKCVFEIACGTGYWTQKISETAKSILATDINDAVIEIAKSKNYFKANVDFQTRDIFNLTKMDKHESLFGGFIWSHLKLSDLNNFLNTINNIVQTSGTIVFIDNNYVEGSNLAITSRDNFGNTYQTRALENGATYKVLKNFPTEMFIRQLLSGRATNIDFINLKYYWILKYNNI
jgi:SAM-dependent methyltransferase